MSNFSHLHVHSFYSLQDGLNSSDQLAERAKLLNQRALGITDHGGVYGLIKHQNFCLKHDIIPILGIELYLVEKPETKVKGEFRSHATAWIKNAKGYENLLKMVSVSNLHYHFYRPRVGFDLLLENCEGLCISTACSASFLRLENGINFFEKLHNKIGDDLYLEVMPFLEDTQLEVNNICLDLHEKFGSKLIATQDVHYLTKELADTHDVLLACQVKQRVADEKRWRFNGTDFFLCDEQHMKNMFIEQGVLFEKEIDEAINNTNEIVEKCGNFRIEKKEIILPIPPQFKDQDEEEVLRGLCEKALNKKFNNNPPQEYIDRFEYELSVIKDFKIIRYFLIVFDLVNFCNKNNILTGPGRGSAAGCLISFLLGVTRIDPIPYGLLFERFLNPSRKNSLADIDIDFEDVKRGQVVEYLKSVYGENSIAGVSTFLKSEIKSTIRDVCRAFDVPLAEADAFSKAASENIDVSLETQEGKDFVKKYPHLIKHIRAIHGCIRGLGRHAAASLISPVDLTLGTRAALAERSGQLVVCMDGYDAEFQGLVKLDILGLSALSYISLCLENIKKNTGKEIILDDIPLDDSKVYKAISSGDTVGGFQISTPTLSRLLKEMGVDNIFQLSDAIAGCRPGAFDSGATTEYIERKKGKKWTPMNKTYEEITQKTYGVILYQEEVIQMIHKVAGLPLAIADQIRRIIGKKRSPEMLNEYREQFVNGCIEQKTLTREEAENQFNGLIKHASYSFNLSHSISYSVLAYWTIFLRMNYTSEYFSAILTCGSESEKPHLLAAAIKSGLSIHPPKIATSHPTKWVAKDGRLEIPFIEIKGLGQRSVETIAQYQQSLQPGFFTSESPVIKGKLLKILQEIGAFTEEVPDTIDDYFPDLGISLKPKSKYKKLYELVGENTKWDSSKLLTGDFIGGHFGREISKINPIPKLFSCTNCDLRNTNEMPVAPVIGKYNIAIVNEAPHWDQKPEKHLFKELGRYGFEKSDFYYTNLMKCACKKPSTENIKICGEWLKQEIKEKKIFILLTMGNANVKLFADDDQGVMRKNGTCSWNEEFGCWVVYSIGANLALWKPEMKSKFEESIKLFVQKCEQLGGLV